jgi:hypothetical protein
VVNLPPGRCDGDERPGRLSQFLHCFVGDCVARGLTMPSLFRFLMLIGVIGGVTYGAMFMLATWFNPKPREITVSIPPDRFAKQP